MIGSARSPRPREQGGAALTLAGPGVIAAGFALPRVPTGGRRSRAAGAIWTGGVPAWGCIFTATRGRSAVPFLQCYVGEWQDAFSPPSRVAMPA